MSSPTVRPEAVSARTQQGHFNSTENLVSNTARGILTGVLAGHIFSLITPLGGAVFGGVQALASTLTDNLLEAVFPPSDSLAVKIIRAAIPIIAGIAAAALAVSLCGFPVTFTASLALSSSLLLTEALAELCYYGTAAVALSTGIFLVERWK